MKIEVGKYYKTRDGRKAGPIENRRVGDKEYPFAWYYSDGKGSRIYRSDGTNRFNSYDDLVAEWVEEAPKNGVFFDGKGGLSIRASHSPVKTTSVTTIRREIIAGVYGRLHVSRQAGSEPRLLIGLASANCHGLASVLHGWSLDDLDEAIHTLNQCREALANPEETK